VKTGRKEVVRDNYNLKSHTHVHNNLPTRQ